MGVPTQISMLHKEKEERTLSKKDENLQKLLSKYGGSKHL
jgi:hypothetical protein